MKLEDIEFANKYTLIVDYDAALGKIAVNFKKKNEAVPYIPVLKLHSHTTKEELHWNVWSLAQYKHVAVLKDIINFLLLFYLDEINRQANELKLKSCGLV